MVLSETKSIKACKLCMFCIDYLSPQERWLKGRKKICIYAKRLCLILSAYSLKGKESSPIWIIQ